MHICFFARFKPTRYQTTANGFTLDQAIQVGVDNPGVPWQRTSGIVAGDRESYEIFSPLFDEIIKEYHGHGKTDFHSRDLDSRKIVDGQLNSAYVLSVRLHTRRSIQGYSLPAGCSRGREGTSRTSFVWCSSDWEVSGCKVRDTTVCFYYNPLKLAEVRLKNVRRCYFFYKVVLRCA